MIEKMYKAYVVSKRTDKNQMISALRDLGLMHIKSEKASAVSSPGLDSLRSRLTSLKRVRMALDEHVDKKHSARQISLSPEEFKSTDLVLTDALDRIKLLGESLGRKRIKLSELSAWGDYSSEDYRYLFSCGLKLFFYTISKKDIARIPENLGYIRLSPVSGQCAIASVGNKLPDSFGAAEFVIDDNCPSLMRKNIEEDEAELALLVQKLEQSVNLCDEYDRQISMVSESIKFEMAQNSTVDGDNLCWIVGFVPQTGLEAFRKYVSDNRFAYLLEDVKEEDNPPTKLVYNKVTGLMKPLFDMLGTIPGYYEYDISLWFLMFFALFFAMIIGDAAYGLLFIAVAAFLHWKKRKTDNLVLLVYVLGIATTVWGAVTGTWFGSDAILADSKFLQMFVIKEFANFPSIFGVPDKTVQDTVMQFCFIVGTIQLSLACVMNVSRKIGAKDLSAMADVGWLIMIDSLYFLVLLLVLNKAVNAMAVFAGVGLGFLLVLVFGCQGPGVKFAIGLASGAGGLFTTFLNTISAFGNIMSYIRLFAVGMASVEIAKSFNSMASSMLNGLALPAGVLILVIGHSLNIVMGLLSVVVHGVRLNLLEFSGQLGMTWTGIAYEPFCKSTESN